MNKISIQYYKSPIGEMLLGSYDNKLLGRILCGVCRWVGCEEEVVGFRIQLT